MDYIEKLKEENITFQVLNETDALSIMQEAYSYYKLLSYSCLFERYRNGSRQGQFVNLDFSQLFYLAEIDSCLSHILMCMCLEIEEKLKAKLIFDAESVCDTHALLTEYYNNDSEYLQNTYVPDNNDAVKYHKGFREIPQLSLNEFLDVVQFGTLERMTHFFYQRYAVNIYNYDFAPFEIRLSSVRRIRNIVAHNNSILNKLVIKTDYKDFKMLSFLGKHGVKNRTLQTNMSKLMISDLCGFFDVYANLVNNKKMCDLFAFVDEKYIKAHKARFENNDLLKTSYTFVKNVLNIYHKKV